MRPIQIPYPIRQCWNSLLLTNADCTRVMKEYERIRSEEPEVSIIIPAFNEETTLAKTLLSLCSNQTTRKVEVIVVNNNSTDQTEQVALACGAHCVLEKEQGITAARNRGLREARGTYILNADADTIYPDNWIDTMVAPLENHQDIALTYGRFSFIPVGKTGRVTYFFYELMTDIVRAFHRRFREEAVNVYGFNSGFRYAQGKAVNGFDHPPGTNEDGWLALKLRDKGFGKLYEVTTAPVWTTDRRIQADGGLRKAILKRIKRFFGA